MYQGDYGELAELQWGETADWMSQLPDAEIEAILEDLPEDFDWNVVTDWDNEELTPVDVEGYEGMEFYVDSDGFLIDGDGDFLLDDANQLINQNNQYVIDENGEWLLVDTEGAALLGITNNDSNWNLGIQDAALGVGLAAALFYGARCLARNYGQSHMIPKEIKRRFKNALYQRDEGNPNNSAAVNDQPADNRNRRMFNEEEETKSSELLGNRPNRNA